MSLLLTTTLVFASFWIPSAALVSPPTGSVLHHRARILQERRSSCRAGRLINDINPSISKNLAEGNPIKAASSKRSQLLQSTKNYHECTEIGSERRKFLTVLTSTTLGLVFPDSIGKNDGEIIISIQPQSALAMDNPLNLKGTFWETGQLYEKSSSNSLLTEEPPETDDFVKILETTQEAFHSPSALVDAISEGRFGDASRLLRGGLVSESKIRLAAYALIDSLPEDDENEYLINELFRVFLRYLDVLDAAVETASRPSLGAVGGGDDPRISLLSLLGEVEEKLKLFIVAIKKGLGV